MHASLSTRDAAAPPRISNPDLDHARDVVAALFGGPADRTFTVRYWDNSEETPGFDSDTPFTLWFKRPGALRRMLLPPSELAIAEAFIDDDVDIEGDAEYAMHLGDVIGSRLKSLTRIASFLPMLQRLPHDDDKTQRELEALRFAGGVRRRRGGSEAIRHHYDVGNDFYKLWLDDEMVYSCAYFTSETESLESAQRAKLDLICRKLRLAPGQKMLDIGCGWGALIMHAATNYGVDATGITVSEAQAQLARERIENAGLSARCRVELVDYRDFNPSARYDRISSIGMMEHVGPARLSGYFEWAYQLMEPRGVFLNHTIVRDGHRGPENAVEKIEAKLWRRDEFIHRYIFPDGRLMAVSEVANAAERAGFELRDLENLREHYVLTLRQWKRRLDASKDVAVKLVGERRYRTWRLYLLAATAGFRRGNTGIVQLVLSKPDESGVSGMPLTRSYML